MNPKVLIPIANGIEELEAVTIIDVLRRGGADVTVASVSSLQVKASRGVNLVADCVIGDCKDKGVDLIILGTPGRTGLKKFFMGSVAQKVVGYSTCPVMVVPPEHA